MLISFGIKSVIDADITMINDICEHPEFSTENDLEGIIYEFGIKIDCIRELSRRLDVIVNDYDNYLKSDLQRKCNKFKEKREKFCKLGASRYSHGRVINSENDFNNPSVVCYEDSDSILVKHINEDDDHK
jgi:hypothetical protein